MNRWNIPDYLEKEITERDKCCVYCHVEFAPGNKMRRAMATWEHIVNDATIIAGENIARCCLSCNCSKGTKQLAHWLESDHCKKRGITRETVADVVKMALLATGCTRSGAEQTAARRRTRANKQGGVRQSHKGT